MAPCFFVSDIHGQTGRWMALCAAIEAQRPAAVFVGGDLLPCGGASAPDARGTGGPDGFLEDVVAGGLARVRRRLGPAYPRVFLILGNDDPRADEQTVMAAGAGGLWDYAHDREIAWAGWRVFGYACVPPTPFRLKDWERYDVSRYVDPGCVSPEDGIRSVPVDAHQVRHQTIARDLDDLAGDLPLGRSIWLFHSPPYETGLDRAALDGRMVDHVPLDVHIGSIAIRRFIERRSPRVTLHGHVHESARLTGRWREPLGDTVMLTAAHDGPELALVRFDPECPDAAVRDLLPIEEPPGTGPGRA